MNLQDQDAYFTVTVDPQDIYQFNQSWPCSGLDANGPAIFFQFHKASGDLVDADVPDDADGSVALSQDAHDFGIREMTHA